MSVPPAAPPGPWTDEHPSASSPPRAGTAAPFTLASTLGALVLLGVSRDLLSAATQTAGTEALMAWVLLATSITAAGVCVYLALVWALATAILLRGRARARTRLLMQLLRALAPRLASRVTVSLLLTTAASGAIALPAQAAPVASVPRASVAEAFEEDAREYPRPGAAQFPAAAVPAAPLPDLAPADAGGEGSPSADKFPAERPPPTEEAPPAQELPPLGWGQREQSQQPGPLHEVSAGESLWSITEVHLAGDGADDDVVAAAWPELYAANEHLIGPDPDRIRPGQLLEIPDPLVPGTEETS